MEGAYQRRALKNHRDVNIAILENKFRDQYKAILDDMIDGRITLDDAHKKAATINLGDALPYRHQQELHDAAQNQIAMESVNMRLDIGDWKGAKAVIDNNPHFSDWVTDRQLSNAVRRIQQQKHIEDTEYDRLRKKANFQAELLGYNSFEDIPPSMRAALVLGKSYTDAQKPLSEAGKEQRDIQTAKQQYGENSPAARILEAAIGMKRAKTSQSKASGLIAERNQRMAELAAQGMSPDEIERDEAVRALDRDIDASDPDYKSIKKKTDAMPKAHQALTAYVTQSGIVAKNAERALMLMTGQENLSEAKKAAQRGDYITSLGGWLQGINRLWAGSTVNEIEGVLQQIRANQMIQTLAEEGEILESLVGSLNLDSPQTVLKTLLRITDAIPENIKAQMDAYNEEFKEVLEKPIGAAN